MAEPATSTTAASFGVLSLLTLWFGAIGGDVGMVVLAAIAGCYLSLSMSRVGTNPLVFILGGVSLALVLSWAVASAIVSVYPGAAGPHLPSLVAFMVGFLNSRIGRILNGAIKKAESKAGVEE